MILGRIAVLASTLLAAHPGLAQVSIQPRHARLASVQTASSPILRVDTNLVLVPVSVIDGKNHPITGLEKENFRIYEDNLPQAISSFSADDEPIALGLVFDTSGSMGGALKQGRRAAARFLGLANPDDEFFLVEFDSAPRLTIPLTSDPGNINGALLTSRSHGSTALIDALYLALHEIKKSKKTRKALILISDGGENNSRYTGSEIMNLVSESDVLIYTVAVGGGYTLADESFGLNLMERLAEISGAHLYAAEKRELPDIASHIGRELRNRYLLGYLPLPQRRDGRYHRIVVKVTPPAGLPKLHARWRLGYYAPT